MKQRLINSFIGICILFLPGCHKNNTNKPLNFVGYENNPVLVPGEPGSWDELIVFMPYVIKNNNLFYMFYTGMNVNGITAIGLATSANGFHYTKFDGNPVFKHGSNGFNSFAIGNAVVSMEDSVWVMYYNARDIAGYGPGTYIGRATAKLLTGPWARTDSPILTTGSRGEWDAGFIGPGPVLKSDDGSYIMYYSGGAEFVTFNDFYIGMARSDDGLTWKKYNNPVTTKHPFRESDPVLIKGNSGDWDSNIAWMASVSRVSGGFEMYYTGGNEQESGIGFATSKDGTHWKKSPGNLTYGFMEDLRASGFYNGGCSIEVPSLVFQDTICFMYFDFGTEIGKIGLATAKVPTQGRKK